MGKKQKHAFAVAEDWIISDFGEHTVRHTTGLRNNNTTSDRGKSLPGTRIEDLTHGHIDIAHFVSVRMNVRLTFTCNSKYY